MIFYLNLGKNTIMAETNIFYWRVLLRKSLVNHLESTSKKKYLILLA